MPAKRLGNLAVATGLGLALLVCLSALGAQVYVQDSPAAEELLAAAADRLDKDEPEEAVRLIQQVLDDHGRKLLPRPEGGYAEARHVAARAVLAEPRLLAVYRQSYEPAAERMLARAGNDRAALMALVERFGLTDSGLAAALRIAGLDLEAGDSDTASIVLSKVSDHPALDQVRAHWQRLAATSALMKGQQDLYQELRSALPDSMPRSVLNELDALAGSIQRSTPGKGLSPLDPLPAATPPQSDDGAVWTHSVGGVENVLIDVYRADRQSVDPAAEEGQFLNTMPHVSGSMLLINDGQTVHAIDSASGLEIWQRTILDSPTGTPTYSRPYSRWVPYGVDVNLVATAADRIVAVMGYGAMVTFYPYYRTGTDTRLACLNGSDGQPVWLVSPEDIDEDLKDAFWYGRPIVSEGQVYATIRRRQRTQFQDAYVVALDLRSGELIWKRHLASTALTDRQAVPSLTHMLLSDGWLYVDSRLGTVSKLSAVDGSVEWMTLLEVDEDLRVTQVQRPWTATAPLMLKVGLLVHDDWAGMFRVIDPKSGQVVRVIEQDEWSSPLYLASTGRDVLAIGPTVVRLSGADLGEQWRYKAGGSIRGRSVVAGDLLYLPAGNSVEVVDLSSGRMKRVIPVAMPANLLAIEGQLIAAQRHRVSSYSSWKIASDRLEQQIAERPDDARPLMSLAWLAYESGRSVKLLATLDRTIELMQRSQVAARQRPALFEQILSMASDRNRNTEEMRRALFDRLAAVTASPDHEVRYRLAYAAFCQATGALPQAVEQYQALLSEPAYRRRLYSYDSGSRQAGLEARRLLEALLKRHGRQLYAPQEAYAADRLAALSQQADPAPLIDLAEAYPLASVTGEALRLAAERTADQGRAREAISLLRRAVQLADQPAALAALFGRQVELYEQIAQPHRARRVLRTMMALHPQIQPLRGGEPTPAAVWLEELTLQSAARGLGTRVNLPISGEATVIDGRMLVPTHQDAEARPSSDLLLVRRGHLESRRASDLTVRWRRPLESDEIELLSIDQQRIWLWNPRAQRITLLDAANGQLLWHDDSIRQKHERIVAGGPIDDRGAQQGAIVRRMVFRNGRAIAVAVHDASGQQINQNEPMIAISDVSVAIADNRGRVVVFNAADGQVRWQGATDVSGAADLLLDGRHLIISGVDAEDTPLVCVYDDQTGQRLHHLPKPKREVIVWSGVTEDGVLIYVSKSQIEAFDLNVGQSRWISKPESQLASVDGAWLSSRRLVVRTMGDADLLWVDLADGQVINRVPIRSTLSVQQRLDVMTDAETWYAVGTGHCLAMDSDGAVMWRDGIIDSTQFEDAVLTDRYLLLLSGPADGQFPSPYGLYVLDRRSGVLVHRQHLGTTSDLAHVAVLGDKIVLSGSSITAVLSGAP